MTTAKTVTNIRLQPSTRSSRRPSRSSSEKNRVWFAGRLLRPRLRENTRPRARYPAMRDDREDVEEDEEVPEVRLPHDERDHAVDQPRPATSPGAASDARGPSCPCLVVLVPIGGPVTTTPVSMMTSPPSISRRSGRARGARGRHASRRPRCTSNRGTGTRTTATTGTTARGIRGARTAGTARRALLHARQARACTTAPSSRRAGPAAGRAGGRSWRPGRSTAAACPRSRARMSSRLPALTLPPKPLAPVGHRKPRIPMPSARPRSPTTPSTARLRNCRRVDAELFLVDRLPLRRRRRRRGRATSPPRLARVSSDRLRPVASSSVDVDDASARRPRRRDWSRLRVSRESVPVVARRRLAVRKTVTRGHQEDDDDGDGDRPPSAPAPTARRRCRRSRGRRS